MRLVTVAAAVLLASGVCGRSAAGELIVPPPDKSIVMRLTGEWDGPSGGFAVTFRPKFSAEAKMHVGHMVGSRKWSKPQRGFLCGFNRHADGKTYFWFYPVDGDGKPFGVYLPCQVGPQGTVCVEVGWSSNRLRLTADGKKLTEIVIKQPITFGETLEIGGMGGKNCGVEVLGFELFKTDPAEVKKKPY